MSAGKSLSKFHFVSVLLESERLQVPFELKNLVTDVDIFEHLNLPYLTALLSFVDTEDVFTSSDILGGEKIKIEIQSNREDTLPIKKTFYVLEVLSIIRTNDRAQVINLQLIEDIGYISNLQNLNKSYRGKASTIIEKIASNMLNKTVVSTKNDEQNMKLIVPNLSPLDAMCWIKNRTTTAEGYPFYLFSTLANDQLYFYDLGTMFREEPINDGINSDKTINSVYTTWQPASRSMVDTNYQRVVINYEINNTENLYLLIKKGVIGSDYEFIDTLKNKRRQVKFDIDKDLIGNESPARIKDLNYETSQPLFSASYQHNEKSFNKYSSRRITNIGTSSPYRTTEADVPAFSAGNNSADYKLTIVSKAMNEIMKKNPLVLTVDGLDYIEGDRHSSIGNQVRVAFLRTSDSPLYGEEDYPLCPKLSGPYLIYAMRHMFKRENYTVSMTCVKVGNEVV